MTNVESMDYTQSHLSIIASLFGTVHCPFSPWELVQTSPVHPKPRDMICSITHKPPYIFLKTATIPTYYGISIAIPRYIAMQLTIVPFIMTRFIIVILLAWSCSWHRICGKATIHNSFIHVALDSLHIPVHRQRHSHRVIFCSKYWVVIFELEVNKSVMIIIIRALSHWGKNDGDYDSPTSRDETPDEKRP